MDKNQVLKAIMNVKNHAKILKKNATTHSEIQFYDSDMDLASPSISHLSAKPFEMASQTMFYNASSFRQQSKREIFHEKSAPRLKRNMRSEICKNQMQRSQGWSKTNTVFRDSKQKSTQFFGKSQGKNSFKPQIHLHNPRVYTDNIQHSQTFSQTGSNIPKNQQPKPVENKKAVRSQKSEQYVPEIIQQLKVQIFRLHVQLEQYKKALIMIKSKYVQMQTKVSERISLDHMIDLLKDQIKLEQDKNQELQQIINKQKQQILSFSSVILQVFEKIDQFRKQDMQNLTMFEKENIVLRNILSLTGDGKGEQLIQSIRTIVDKKNKEEEKQIIGSIKINKTISKTAQDMLKKWNEKFNQANT